MVSELKMSEVKMAVLQKMSYKTSEINETNENSIETQISSSNKPYWYV